MNSHSDSEDSEFVILGEENFIRVENKASHISLTPEQLQIVNSDIKQYQQILACAGSGKTTTLSHRVKYLINHKIDASRILITTFTKNATNQIKEKVNNPEVKVYTIDAFALWALTRYSEYNSKNKNLSEFSLDLANYLKQDPLFWAELANAFDYIFIDEFQDISPAQYNIFKNMHAINNNLIIITVGDDDQNIYEFRDTSSIYINKFREDYSPVVYSLSINFRCQANIVKIANNSIVKNTSRYDKPTMKSYQQINDIKPTISFNFKREQEATQLLEHIKSYINKYDLHKIAILSPKKFALVSQKDHHNSSITKILAEDNIPFIAVNITKPEHKILQNEYKNKIWVSTIHQSKGLEWDVVFVLGVNDASFPHDKDNQAVEESRRLYYVATTRAKTYLHFYYCLAYNDNQPERNVSRFLMESNLNNFDLLKNNNIIALSKISNKQNDPVEDNSVTHIIQNINAEEIQKMRNANIIPNLIYTSRDHYEQVHKFPFLFKDSSDQAIYGTFLDAYTTREITRTYLNLQTIKNTTISKLLTHLHYKQSVQYLQSKYSLSPDLIKLIQLKNSEKPVYNLQENIIAKIESAFYNYTNPLKSSYDILQDIMLIAIAENFYRSKVDYYFYKTYHLVAKEHLITEDHRLDIKNYIKSLSSKITLKDHYEYESKNGKIIGENDAEIQKNIMLEFKTSMKPNVNFDWSLQLLSYSALTKSKIKQIQVMNLLTGIEYTADLPENQSEYNIPLLEELILVNKRLMKLT